MAWCGRPTGDSETLSDLDVSAVGEVELDLPNPSPNMDSAASNQLVVCLESLNLLSEIAKISCTTCASQNLTILIICHLLLSCVSLQLVLALVLVVSKINLG